MIDENLNIQELIEEYNQHKPLFSHITKPSQQTAVLVGSQYLEDVDDIYKIIAQRLDISVKALIGHIDIYRTEKNL